MKKRIFLGVFYIGIGFLLGEFLFKDKIELVKHLKNTDTYYFLQEGVYQKKEVLKTSTSTINQKLIDYENKKYYVYVGITKDLEVLEKLKEIYENQNIKIHIKEKNLSNNEFKENLTQFDLLIKETEEEDQILTIEKVVLANYEEVFKKK